MRIKLTPTVTEINLVKGHEPVGVRQRCQSHPLIESYDSKHPEKLLDPERELIYRELEQHEKRLDTLDEYVQQLRSAKSIPVKLGGPGGFSITGNWRFIGSIAVLISLVAILYIVLRYGKH